MHDRAASPWNAGRTLPAELYEREEVGALLRACGRSRTGRRNRALIALMAGAGLRVSEALALEPRDVGREVGELRVRRGKGARARTVPLDVTTAALLEPWEVVRPRRARTLACTLAGKPVKSSYVRAALPRLARRAGVEKRVHAHGLRHFYACELDREGVPLAQISTLLGHASATVTAVYLERLRGVDRATAARLRERDWLPLPSLQCRANQDR